MSGESDPFHSLEWRLVGPFEGGRVTAVAGVPGAPRRFFFGAAGGGVWRSDDGGLAWHNVSDGYLKTGSVGALAVAGAGEILYAGMGEAQIRGTAISHGDGVYKSINGGLSWAHLGLAATRQISRLRVHPDDPGIVYAAAQGNPWAPTRERGIYRSRDGGRSWRQTLFLGERTGAADLAFHPLDPEILYAAFWEHQRLPWKIVSGGSTGGLYRSSDGGDTWEKLTLGLPAFLGKVGVAVSPVRPERVWAIVEAEAGGLYRSDDGGRTFAAVSHEMRLRSRPWYYTKVFADPLDAETVYVLNDPMLRSTDGGETFEEIRTPHSDHHDLWIDPADPHRMIVGNDGGAAVSFDGGESWSSQANQPTGQIYRVTTDAGFPYVLYGGQQDHLTVAIASRAKGGGIGRQDWHSVGGCENSTVAVVPEDPSLVYASCCHGMITRYRTATGETKAIMAYPVLGLGSAPRELPYRFNWNTPICVSPHAPEVVYHGGNVLFRSRDRGLSWEAVSPDLTRNEREKQGPGGGPITNEGAGAEIYGTLTCIVESPHEPDTIWAGTDDGLVHLTRDGGRTWREVTPAGLGEAQINAIEVSPHDPGTAYLAVNRYRFGELAPLVFGTTTHGASWRLLVDGLPADASLRVVREDPGRRGLLYAGTATGLFLSWDGGRYWQPFQSNLPVVPITDLQIRDRNLVASTEGRAFWILDDLSPLHQWDDAAAGAPFHLFKPRDTPLAEHSYGEETPANHGRNPPDGVILYYVLGAEAARESGVLIEILDAAGRPVRAFWRGGGEAGGDPEPATEPGLSRLVWDLRRSEVTAVPGLLRLPQTGYRVAPGTYRARLTVGGRSLTQAFELLPDPRLEIPAAEFAEQQALLAAAWECLDAVHRAVAEVRERRRQLRERVAEARRRDRRTAAAAGEALDAAITAWEAGVVEPRQQGIQDFVSLPARLNAQLMFLVLVVDAAEPAVIHGARERLADLEVEWTARETRLREILDRELPAAEALLAAADAADAADTAEE